MPTDRPNAAELVEAVREFLEDHVAPNVEGQLAFHARVAINALAIVERTMGQGDAMDDAELEFPYDRLTRFKDMEGAGRVVANPKSLRKRYLTRIREFTGRLKSDCFERKISYNLANTKEPYDKFLAAYLDKRSRIG